MISFSSIFLVPILMLLGVFHLHAQTTEVSVEALIRDHFGAQVEVVKDPNPTVLKGDFNGDGMGDLAVLVSPKGKRGELSPGVRMIHTAEGVRDPEAAEILNGRNSLALVLGSASGWKSPKTGGKFLIYSFGWIGWKGSETGKLVVLSKSKLKRDKKGYATLSPNNRVSLPGDSRGDLILVPTEGGINTILYWNGKTYRFWLDPGETS